MSDIQHEIKIQASPERVFKALSTVDDLRSWHTAKIYGKLELNETLNFQGTDKPIFHWKVIRVEPNKQIVWECVEGPGNSV